MSISSIVSTHTGNEAGSQVYRDLLTDMGVIITEANRVATQVNAEHDSVTGGHTDINPTSITLNGVQRTTWGTLIDSGTATSGGASTLTDTGADWGATGNPLAGGVIKITGGTGSGQTRGIASHTGTAITTDSAWTTPPDATSTYEIYGTGNQNLEGVIAAGDLGAIAATLVKNAVAYAIYDVKNDSDGGRKITKGCVHTSMGNQVTKQLVVLEAATLNLYDLTDPSVALLKSWTVAGGTDVKVLDGKIVYSGTGGLYIIDLITDDVWRHNATNLSKANQNAANYNQGTATFSAVSTTGAIVNATVNKVAITVRDNAPIDSATGLPKPTICAFTGGGTSVIHNTGSVVNSNNTSAISYGIIDDHGTVWVGRTGSPTIYGYADIGSLAAAFTEDFGYAVTSIPAALAGNAKQYAPLPHGMAVAGSSGLEIWLHNYATGANSAKANITNTHNTGYLVGDIRRAIGYDSASTLADKSVKAGSPAEVGTLTKTPVAGGRTAVSGFTGANYIQDATSADFNALGTGDSLLFHANEAVWGTAGVERTLFSMGDGVSAGSVRLYLSTANQVLFTIHNGTSFAFIMSTNPIVTDTAKHTLKLHRRSGVFYFDVDGKTLCSGTSALTVSNATGFYRIGEAQHTSAPWTGGQFSGYVRISATAPTAEQSKAIAEQENMLNGGALCLLSAAAVTGLDYNADAEILKVQTAAANDFLHGLKVVVRGAALTDTTDRGFDYVTVNGTTDVRVNMTKRILRDQLADKAEELAKAQQGDIEYYFTLGAGVTSYRFTAHAGMKPIAVYDLTAGTFIDMDTNPATQDGFIWQANGLTATNKYKVTLRRV